MSQSNNLLVMGLDVGSSKALITKQLQQIANEISKSGDVKVVAQLDTEATQRQLQAQLNNMKLDINSNGIKTYGNQLNNIAKVDLSKLQRGLQGVNNNVQRMGGLFGNLKQSLAGALQNVLRYKLAYQIINGVTDAFKDMIEEVENIQHSLLELSKVCDASGEELEAITDKAYNLGKAVAKTTSQTLDAITTFKRAGFSMEQSFDFAEDSLKMVNVSENIKDSSEAAKYLISVMKGYDNTSAEFSKKILDSVNQVSNTQAIDFDNLISGAQNLSAVAEQAQVSFDEMLGLLTAGYEVLGSESKVSNGLITIFSRLQQIQLDGEEEVETTAKLQEDFYNATKGAVNIIDQETGKLRSAYDIMSDMADIWDSLDANVQSALATASAGTRRKNVFLSIMQNWDTVKKSIDSSINSVDSAEDENRKYLDSVEGLKVAYDSAFQELSRAVLDSDWLKDLIIAGTDFIEVLTNIVKTDEAVSGTVGLITDALRGLASILKELSENKFFSTLAKDFLVFKGIKGGIDIFNIFRSKGNNLKQMEAFYSSAVNGTLQIKDGFIQIGEAERQLMKQKSSTGRPKNLIGDCKYAHFNKVA